MCFISNQYTRTQERAGSNQPFVHEPVYACQETWKCIPIAALAEAQCKCDVMTLTSVLAFLSSEVMVKLWPS